MPCYCLLLPSLLTISAYLQEEQAAATTTPGGQLTGVLASELLPNETPVPAHELQQMSNHSAAVSRVLQVSSAVAAILCQCQADGVKPPALLLL
jgi:hypothetical protein